MRVMTSSVLVILPVGTFLVDLNLKCDIATLGGHSAAFSADGVCLQSLGGTARGVPVVALSAIRFVVN